ncbi:SulP family inorganic anion transporter [Breoghania sp.]|uniref:SulP family inorganic anion transporter n=1 Tax=Breoghania sp. TaxID=2065378 RepID=UPI002AA6CC8A|nr:SulP family inorganic anion transporter [Breoghania sp.]
MPKLIICLREGYSLSYLRADVIAGLTVAIVALPLAMALAIASGASPDKGLITAVIAGFLISAFGGSRFQIGGPTGAFVVVVFNVIATHGYSGLVLSTLMAGMILVLAGLARLGSLVKYIPETVVTGFTAGIAVIIFTSQISDILGLTLAQHSGGFLGTLEDIWASLSTISPASIIISCAALTMIVLVRRFRPKWPAFLIAVTVASLVAWALALPIETIGSKFGGITSALPMPELPDFTLTRLRELLPSALTIAFLAGVESLLSAVVADGMTGRRHRSDCELIAQGIANMGSALFGGLPATGAIARTATNVRTGARTPIAGMFHAVFVLAFMMFLSPLANFIPLASLAAVLVVVAWNMSEADKVRHLLHAPFEERVILVVTLGLTVLVDLTVAIEVGVVMAALAFMHRMSKAVAVTNEEEDDDPDAIPFTGTVPATDQRLALSENTEVFKLRGPLFFGAATRLDEALNRAGPTPEVFILRMREVPLIDATGVSALTHFVDRCEARGTRVVVSGIQEQPKAILEKMGLAKRLEFSETYTGATIRARSLSRTDGTSSGPSQRPSHSTSVAG